MTPDAISVRSGDAFEVALEGTPTAGFVWDVIVEAEDQALIEVLGSEFRLKEGTVGGSASQVFRFHAHRLGTARLLFSYRRPWEKTPRAQRTVVIRVEAP